MVFYLSFFCSPVRSLLRKPVKVLTRKFSSDNLFPIISVFKIYIQFSKKILGTRNKLLNFFDQSKSLLFLQSHLIYYKLGKIYVLINLFGVNK
jgi:hypothetical protein